jgi:hypothetical protein
MTAAGVGGCGPTTGMIRQPSIETESIMFRKFLVAGVATLGLLTPMAVTTANAREREGREFRRERREEREYHVYYRSHCEPCWRCAGQYCRRCDADRAADHFRHEGFEVAIR